LTIFCTGGAVTTSSGGAVAVYLTRPRRLALAGRQRRSGQLRRRRGGRLARHAGRRRERRRLDPALRTGRRRRCRRELRRCGRNRLRILRVDRLRKPIVLDGWPARHVAGRPRRIAKDAAELRSSRRDPGRQAGNHEQCHADAARSAHSPHGFV
jgi:hypothetical protein